MTVDLAYVAMLQCGSVVSCEGELVTAVQRQSGGEGELLQNCGDELTECSRLWSWSLGISEL